MAIVNIFGDSHTRNLKGLVVGNLTTKVYSYSASSVKGLCNVDSKLKIGDTIKEIVRKCNGASITLFNFGINEISFIPVFIYY